MSALTARHGEESGCPNQLTYLWRPGAGTDKGREVFSQQAPWMLICG